jgi:glycosyltransferase involved in cell wall biosynthesis
VLWAIAAPFFMFKGSDAGARDVWIDDFVQSERHRFLKIYQETRCDDWHSRKKRATSLKKWAGYWSQARRAFHMRPDGLITVFPQLAAVTGAQKLLHRRTQPIVAWCFNIGACPPAGLKSLAGLALRSVDRVIVHSRGEMSVVSQWFGVDADKIRFIPLQRAEITCSVAEERHRPFIVAQGSANRDYATLFKALERIGLPAVIVAAPRALAGLQIPSNVEVLSNLAPEQCLALAQRARLSVVPLRDISTAAGQVTVVEAMRMSRPIVATRSVGTIDYIRDGENGMLVDPGDVDGLASRMMLLWNDDLLRRNLGQAAFHFAKENLSDEAAASAMLKILDEFR